ncbi:MAG: FAD-dependent oxidoreductase [archaeon]
MSEVFDTGIVGAGPAGLTAAIYLARYNVKAIVFGKDFGKVAETFVIENFPGFKSVSGLALSQKMIEQVKSLNVPVELSKVSGIKKEKELFVLTVENKEFKVKTIIIATGLKTRELGIPGENEFKGKGVSYCATCEAAFFKDKVVGVIGGSDAAAETALLLSEFAGKVTIFYRKAKLRAQPILVKKVLENKKIKVVYNSNVVKVMGSKFMEKALVDVDGDKKEFVLDGLFVEIGSSPDLSFIEGLGVKVDKQGFIDCNISQETNVKNVFSAGDITNNSNNLKQITCACSEGAIAANAIFKLLKQK